MYESQSKEYIGKKSEWQTKNRRHREELGGSISVTKRF